MSKRNKVSFQKPLLYLREYLRKMHHPGIDSLVYTPTSLGIYYDSLQISIEELTNMVQSIPAHSWNPAGAKSWYLPVCYEAEYGIDLQEMSRLTHLPPEKLVQAHLERQYQVAMLGFLPGFMYLEADMGPIRVPRKNNPRTLIPAGAVAVAENYSGVYPLSSPGGWHILGQCPVPMFSNLFGRVCLGKEGDFVHFYSVSKKVHEAIKHGFQHQFFTWDNLFKPWPFEY